MIQLFAQARNKRGKTMAIMKVATNEWDATERAKRHADNKKWTNFEVVQKRKVCKSLHVEEETNQIL